MPVHYLLGSGFIRVLKNMQDEKISKITEMLLAGGKMLGVHCGSCQSPLFEYGGEITCPVCGVLKETPAEKPEPKAEPLKKLENAIYSKLDSLSEQLKKETDHTKTLELLDGIKATLETLERLKKRGK
jgi:uncharacterized Zn finger protein (UPF0148 family)